MHKHLEVDVVMTLICAQLGDVELVGGQKARTSIRRCFFLQGSYIFINLYTFPELDLWLFLVFFLCEKFQTFEYKTLTSNDKIYLTT